MHEQPRTPRRLGMARSVAAEVLAAGPRTAAYATRAVLRPLRSVRKHPEIPAVFPTADLVASVLTEQLMKAALPAVFAPNDEGSFDAVRREVNRAIELLDANGWLDDPRGFHRKPPPPEHPRVERAVFYGVRYERLSFESGYVAPEGSPGGDTRWNAPANRTAHAYVLRHLDASRPWVVLQHGYGVGHPWDFVLMMDAPRIFKNLGFNVIAPIAPYHGPRRVLRRGGMGMTSFDYVRNLHAYGQATWDIRRCIAWAETQGATSFALYGMSMGGFIVSVVAGVEDRVGTVIAGIPAVDMAAAIRRRTPTYQWPELERNGLFGECLDIIHRPVSPLSFTPLVPRERRFIYAGVADRITTPRDAYRLWQHWERPNVLWFRGTHVTASMGTDVKRFIDGALRTHSQVFANTAGRQRDGTSEGGPDEGVTATV